MISQTVLKLGRRCRRLSGFARGVGGQVAAAASEPFESLPATGRAFLDLYEYQVQLGEVLELCYAELVELDRRLADALKRGSELRAARGRLSTRLRADLSGLRDTLSGVLDPRAVHQLLGPIVDRLPKEPAELQPLAERLFAHLAHPALEVPPLPEGVEIDPPAIAEGFAAPMRELGATLGELADVEGLVEHARSRKAEAQERLKVVCRRVERFFVALYEVSGCPGLAQRLRQTGRGRFSPPVCDPATRRPPSAHRS